MSQKPKIYFENLDGLRFMCFLSVFFYHSFHTEYDYIKSSAVYIFVKWHLFQNGNLGVNFFFVLSGFLITYLLIKERNLLGRIDVISFWKRRIFRIWPLFYFCVFFGFLIFPFLKEMFGQASSETASLIYYLTFLNNFDFIRNGLPDASILGVLWSVAIEEQFYLVWPVLLFLLPYGFYPVLFISVILFSIFFRFQYQEPVLHEFHTVSCMGDLAIGAFGAWIVQRRIFVERIRSLSTGTIYAGHFVLFLILFFRDILFQWMGAFERTMIAIVFLFVILEQNYSVNSFYKMQRFKTLSKLGTMTYGLYCLHFIGILTITTLTSHLGWNTELWQVIGLETTLALSLSIVISKLSFQYYESPFLRMGKKRSHILTRE